MTDEHPKEDRHFDPKAKWAWIGFAAVAGFFLWTEHRAHLLGALPYLAIMACPLMHFFMHGRHGHHGHGQHEHRAEQDENSGTKPGEKP